MSTPRAKELPLFRPVIVAVRFMTGVSLGLVRPSLSPWPTAKRRSRHSPPRRARPRSLQLLYRHFLIRIKPCTKELSANVIGMSPLPGTRCGRTTISHRRFLGLWPPCALCQVVLIESLPDQRLDDGLTAHVKVLSSLIQFLQHAGGNVHIDALNRLNHAALALEETGNVLALIGQPRNRIGGNGFGGFTSFLHTVETLALSRIEAETHLI